MKLALNGITSSHVVYFKQNEANALTAKSEWNMAWSNSFRHPCSTFSVKWRFSFFLRRATRFLYHQAHPAGIQVYNSLTCALCLHHLHECSAKEQPLELFMDLDAVFMHSLYTGLV